MSVVAVLRSLADELEKQPYGPAVSDTKAAGENCVRLQAGDVNMARTLWRLIADECGGYFPDAAAIALKHAANPNLVPDVSPPEVN
jgi:hypothetical protein